MLVYLFAVKTTHIRYLMRMHHALVFDIADELMTSNSLNLTKRPRSPIRLDFFGSQGEYFLIPIRREITCGVFCMCQYLFNCVYCVALLFGMRSVICRLTLSQAKDNVINGAILWPHKVSLLLEGFLNWRLNFRRLICKCLSYAARTRKLCMSSFLLVLRRNRKCVNVMKHVFKLIVNEAPTSYRLNDRSHLPYQPIKIYHLVHTYTAGAPLAY